MLLNNSAMQNQIVISSAKQGHCEAIIALLQSEKLPIEDLSQDISGFLTATDNGLVIGAVGLQIFGAHGLLRSLVVKPEYRRLKIAAELVSQLEIVARQHSLTHLYLLTETAQGYFAEKGYHLIDREQVPNTIQQSTQFNNVCPVSAAVMVKKL